MRNRLSLFITRFSAFVVTLVAVFVIMALLFGPLVFGVLLAQTSTTVLVRTGQQPRVVLGKQGTIYNYAEAYQERGAWVVPDVGYIDFGRPDTYREVFGGGGITAYADSNFVWVQELLVDKATGRLSGGALSLISFTAMSYKLTRTLSASTVVFPYIPLNRSARKQIVLENAKMEYDLGPAKVGAGYGAYRYCNLEWQNKPFLTTTLKGGRYGDFELWLQHLPHTTGQLQLRYAGRF